MNKKAKDVKRRIHIGIHTEGKKSRYSYRSAKKLIQRTLVDRWKMSHETIGIKEIKTRVC